MKRKSTSPSLLLWEVYYSAFFYDDDFRMPGNVPVDKRFYVLAGSHSDALEKAESLIEKCRKKNHEDQKVIATMVTLENFVAARDRSNDGRLGYHSTDQWEEVALSSEVDKKSFRLGVCLIPIKE